MPMSAERILRPVGPSVVLIRHWPVRGASGSGYRSMRATIGAMEASIRTMQRSDVDAAMELAAREGWNPGLHDAACFFAADAQGFLQAEVDGQRVGCISAVAYGEGFGFIGLYIIEPAWRCKGMGWQLWQAGMARLAGRVVGLDGVPAQQGNYRRSGFELAWRNARFAGRARHDGAPDAAGIVPLSEVAFGALCDADRHVFPAPRPAFLRAWITQPLACGLAVVEQGRIAGWGLIRPCREGYKVGPLVADGPAIAQTLFMALQRCVAPGASIFLDVPLPNGDAVALAQQHGMDIVFETARMVRGAAPAVAIERIYGVTSFELG